MKTFKELQEKLTHISDTLKKIKTDIKNAPGDKPFIQTKTGEKPEKL